MRTILASTLTLLTTSLSLNQPIYAQAVTREYASPFKAGITYYQKGDYKTASGYLRRATTSENRSNPSAHYWLASSLMKEGRYDEALLAYATAYSLSPNTAVGHNSLQVLHLYKARIKESEKLRTQISSLVRKGNGYGQSNQPFTNSQSLAQPEGGNSEEGLVDPVKIASIKNQLKPVQKHQRPGPTMNQFQGWPYTQQANYVYAGAFQAISKAQSNVDSAQDQLKEAQVRANSLLPNFRAYGEDEAVFEKRKAASKKVYKELLEPYQKELDNCTSYLEEAVAIKNRAQQAQSTPLYYTPPYGGFGRPIIYR